MNKEHFIITFTLIFVFTLTFVGSGLATLSKEFGGSQDFTTLQEAYDYQNIIITEASSVNASVDWADISIGIDKIHFNWQVFMNGGVFSSDDFKYGERKMSPYVTMGTWIFFMVFEICLFIWKIRSWNKKDTIKCIICSTYLVSPNRVETYCPNSLCTRYKQNIKVLP
jgi:hypothetical protein